MTITLRQQQILQTLAEQSFVRIQELTAVFGVSAMTVHRDLDELERAGMLRKVRGGAAPLETQPEAEASICAACYAPLNPRTQVVLHMADGSQRRACCPHCGMMMLGRADAVTGVLVTDFLHGRAVNARSATYLTAPDLSICCMPTVLAFEDTHDAQRFQTGFGGQLFNLDEAIHFIHTSMHL